MGQSQRQHRHQHRSIHRHDHRHHPHLQTHSRYPIGRRRIIGHIHPDVERGRTVGRTRVQRHLRVHRQQRGRRRGPVRHPSGDGHRRSQRHHRHPHHRNRHRPPRRRRRNIHRHHRPRLRRDRLGQSQRQHRHRHRPVSTVTITDTTPTYKLTPDTRTVAEGSSTTFTVTLSEAAPSGGLAFNVTYGYSGSNAAAAADLSGTPSGDGHRRS